MKRQMTTLFILGLIATWGIVGAFTTPATAQLYAECCPNRASLKNFEWASAVPGTTFTVEDKKLRIANITFDWNMFVVDKNVWKRLGSPTNFTIEATFSDIVKGNKNNIGWLYVVARYAQEDPRTYNRRLNMIKWTLDEEGGNNGLYMYQWLNGQRIRYVANQVADAGLPKKFISHTHVGQWKNDPKKFGKDSIDVKMVVTADTVSVDLWGEEELDKYPNDTNAGGRPGVGVWSEGGSVSVSFVVYGSKGFAVDASGKVAITWGNIKAKF